MPNVSYQREELLRLKVRWDLVRDCLSGEERIKEMGKTYLPMPNAADESKENFERYLAYKKRAVYYNVTGRTLKGMIGTVFCKDPAVEMPDELDIFNEDVDGGGVSLIQQARKTLGYCLAFGRGGLLVDYPSVESPTSKEAQAMGEVRPTITLYEPWDVINWRVKTVGAKKMLTLLVLTERWIANDDGFEHQYKNTFRVLVINDQGFYEAQIWEAVVSDQGRVIDYEMTQQYMPTDGSGNKWKVIPFTFFGSENNDTSPDLPPLYDLAVLNIAHYRNSADYEEACYIAGQPTPYFAGLTQQWVEQVLKGRVELGSRAAVPLPVGGTAGLLQAQANSMPFEAMGHKERQMVALGAKLVEQATVQRTATEAGFENATESSVLSTCAKNVSAAYTQAIKWAAQFAISNPDTESISFELNEEYSIGNLDPQTLTAIIAAWQSGALSDEEMRDNLIHGGYAYQDFDEYQEAIDAAGPKLGLPAAAAALKQALPADDMMGGKTPMISGKSPAKASVTGGSNNGY